MAKKEKRIQVVEDRPDHKCSCCGSGRANAYTFKAKDINFNIVEFQVEASTPEEARALLREYLPSRNDMMLIYHFEAMPRISVVFKGTHSDVLPGKLVPRN